MEATVEDNSHSWAKWISLVTLQWYWGSLHLLPCRCCMWAVSFRGCRCYWVAEDRGNVRSRQWCRLFGLFASQSDSHPTKHSWDQPNGALLPLPGSIRQTLHTNGLLRLGHNFNRVPFLSFTNQQLCSFWPCFDKSQNISRVVNKALTLPWVIFMIAPCNIHERSW